MLVLGPSRKEPTVSKQPNPTGHPARFSQEVLDLAAELLMARYPEWLGRPYVFDPFAGTGEALARLSATLIAAEPEHIGFQVTGVEIEPAYIVNAELVKPGDALDRSCYEQAPTGGLVIFTSPVYPNGMADHHRPKDTSVRRTYLVSLMALTGDAAYEMDEHNMGRYGFRGTRRDGTSKRRAAYWDLAEKAVAVWAGCAQHVLLNVSDFMHSNGQVEPVVDDWKAVLHKHGFTEQFDHPVATSRMRMGANHDQRVANEVIVEARRG